MISNQIINRVIYDKKMLKRTHDPCNQTHKQGCKPTFLYSNYPWFNKLYLPLPPGKEWTSDMVKRQGPSISKHVIQTAVANLNIEESKSENQIKCVYILHSWGEHCPECRYVDSQGVTRICGASDLKSSQHYPVRFGAAVAECFLEHYEEVKTCVKETKKNLLASPQKEVKDYGGQICLYMSWIYRFIGLSVYRFIGLFAISLSVYRFIGLSVYLLSVYRFIGLSVYRFIGLVFLLSCWLQDPGFAMHANLRQVIKELAQ